MHQLLSCKGDFNILQSYKYHIGLKMYSNNKKLVNIKFCRKDIKMLPESNRTTLKKGIFISVDGKSFVNLGTGAISLNANSEDKVIEISDWLIDQSETYTEAKSKCMKLMADVAHEIGLRALESKIEKGATS